MRLLVEKASKKIHPPMQIKANVMALNGETS
ncbi:hypothetical protein COLO4_15484 [Corchorus olitorius]|uniref:Uncharacterized protein n=1 Tax=Corchorus olitorius TaxID=93759 RepID=A0A1R3JMV1_9ROSI|nr:hypothetical protein COLO4_15484 [Corchorus olitorius]